MPQIVVTGMGLITSLGQGVDNNFQKIARGDHGISINDAWDMSQYKTKMAAQIKQQLSVITSKSIKHLDRGHQLLLCAVKEALEEANLLKDIEKYRIGIVVGTSLAGMISMQKYDTQLNEGSVGDTRALVNQPLHVCADIVAKEFGLNGPRMVISTACTASTIAIGSAVAMLRNSKADIIIAAGCDPLSYISYTGFSCMRNMSQEPCSPFSLDEGLTLGEGAGAIVLETEKVADTRKARKQVAVLDYMISADAYHATSPDPKGAGHTYLIRKLIQRSNIKPDDIDYINMHGTGTNGNDITESRTINNLFYHENHQVPVSSIKGAVGHTLGAAGIIESIITIKALEENTIPPTTNFSEAREGCTLDYVPNQSRSSQINTALVQNFAFGGNNAAIIFSKQQSNRDRQQPRRVVVTGASAITPLGYSFSEIAEKIKSNKSALSNIYSETYDRYFKAAFLQDFTPRTFVKANFRRMDKLSQIIVAASYKALIDSGLNPKTDPQCNIGFICGTMSGHVESNLKFHREILNNNIENIDPFIFPNTVTNAGAGQAAIVNRLRGCNIALSIGQASGLAAINLAYDLIKDGLQPAIIAGGADELNDYILYNYYKAGFARSQRENKIIKDDRLELNEGAAFFMLEDYDHAIKRGANIYAEIIDYQSISDVSITQSKESFSVNVKRNIAELLENNNTNNQINSVFLSGLNIKNYQVTELQAICSMIGHKPKVYSPYKNVGISGLTSALSFGLGCLNVQGFSMVNGASIGGAFYSTFVKNMCK